MKRSKKVNKGGYSLAFANVKKFFPQVKKLRDADENAVVHVTAADVKASSKKDHNNCAMAVAAKRELHATGMVVSRSMAYVVNKDEAIRFSLPTSVQKEIVSFDRGAGFAEGAYQLDRPSKSNRLGSYRMHHHLNPDRSHTANGKRRFRHLTRGVRAVLGGKKA